MDKSQQYKQSLQILSLQNFSIMQQAKEDKILNSLRDIERVTQETKIIAVTTNAMAYQNGEKLERIEGKLKGINGQLVKAEDTAKEITSFWYYLKKKVKGVFGIKRNYFTNTTDAQILPKEGINRIEERQYKQVRVQQGASEQDEIMDSILSNLAQLKRYGKDFGEEIDRQNKTIDRIDPQMDKAINKMGKVTKILKKELGN